MHCYFYSEARGPKFGPLHFHSTEIVKKMRYLCLEIRSIPFHSAEIETAIMIIALFYLFCLLVLVFHSVNLLYNI